MKKVEIVFERVERIYQRILVEHDDNDLLNEALDEVEDKKCKDIYDVKGILEEWNDLKVLEVEEEYDWAWDSLEWYDQTVLEEVK